MVSSIDRPEPEGVGQVDDLPEPRQWSSAVSLLVDAAEVQRQAALDRGWDDIAALYEQLGQALVELAMAGESRTEEPEA
jgi:hypothetical protein